MYINTHNEAVVLARFFFQAASFAHDNVIHVGNFMVLFRCLSVCPIFATMYSALKCFG